MPKKLNSVSVVGGAQFYADSVQLINGDKFMKLSMVDPDTGREFDGPDYPMLIPASNIIAIQNAQLPDDVYNALTAKVRSQNFIPDAPPEAEAITPASLGATPDTE